MTTETKSFKPMTLEEQRRRLLAPFRRYTPIGQYGEVSHQQSFTRVKPMEKKPT